MFDKAWFDGMKKKFDEEKAKVGKGFDKPDGAYQGLLSLVEFRTSKAGKPMVAWSYTIEAGDLQGEQYMDFDMLERQDGFYWLGIKLSNFGVDIRAMGDPSELVDVFAAISAAKYHVKFSLKTNKTDSGEFQNFRIVKVLDSDNDPTSGAAPAEDVTLSVGMTIVYSTDSGNQEGEVVAVDDAKEEATVFNTAAGAPVTIKYASIIEAKG